MVSKLKQVLIKYKKRFINGFFYTIREEVEDRLFRFKIIRLIYLKVFKKNNPKGHIFIFGCYNSGTTILKKILSLHPEITSTKNETYFYTNSYNDLEYNLMARGSPALIEYTKLTDQFIFNKNKYMDDLNYF